jgi:sodium-dependent dicarboxylate transporter 2/3/5
MTRKDKIALLTGPCSFLLFAALPSHWLGNMPWPAQLTAAITLWIATWWIAEPVDIAATSLLPLVLLSLTGVAPIKSVSAEYGNEIIFLFMSGFFMGKCIERWQLHRRIALSMVRWIGSDPSRTVLGFMIATATISMWISNTATAVMMTPVAIAVAGGDDRQGNFGKVLLLGVGYACSIGGLATLIGTPTNAIFVSYVQQKMGETVSFGKWLLFGLPLTAVMLAVCWQMLVRMFPLGASKGSSQQEIKRQLSELGGLSRPEKRILYIFGGVVLAWVSGSFLWYEPLNIWLHTHAAGLPLPENMEKVPRYCSDTLVAIVGAVLFFLTPSGDDQAKKPLLDWHTASTIPWNILILFGGGLALAKGFDSSGLAAWMGDTMKGLGGLPHVIILFTVLAVVVLLSEVASNIATASMMMPVLAALAGSIDAHPFGLLLSATLAASLGFGLPIATAPNSIVYASGKMSAKDMAKAGFLLDLLAVLTLMVFIYWLLPWVWGFSV